MPESRNIAISARRSDSRQARTSACATSTGSTCSLSTWRRRRSVWADPLASRPARSRSVSYQQSCSPATWSIARRRSVFACQSHLAGIWPAAGHSRSFTPSARARRQGDEAARATTSAILGMRIRCSLRSLAPTCTAEAGTTRWNSSSPPGVMSGSISTSRYSAVIASVSTTRSATRPNGRPSLLSTLHPRRSGSPGTIGALIELTKRLETLSGFCHHASLLQHRATDFRRDGRQRQLFFRFRRRPPRSSPIAARNTSRM